MAWLPRPIEIELKHLDSRCGDPRALHDAEPEPAPAGPRPDCEFASTFLARANSSFACSCANSSIARRASSAAASARPTAQHARQLDTRPPVSNGAPPSERDRRRLRSARRAALASPSRAATTPAERAADARRGSVRARAAMSRSSSSASRHHAIAQFGLRADLHSRPAARSVPFCSGSFRRCDRRVLKPI